MGQGLEDQGSGFYLMKSVMYLESSSSSSSTFISRPTPLRAYAVLTTGGTPPPMTICT